MATGKFQQIIWQIIKDCPGAYNIHDDLQVVGANDKEHDENLERVMRKLGEHALTLNYGKCEVGVHMGDVLSGEGLKISDRRVEAIVKSPPPRNQSEVPPSSVQSLSPTLQVFQVHYGILLRKEPSGSGAIMKKRRFVKLKIGWFKHQSWPIFDKARRPESLLMPHLLAWELY